MHDRDLKSWRENVAPDLLGNDDSVLRALEIVRSAADTDCTVLVTGESGTGKELVARAVHGASPRRGGPFVAVNCAAVPDSLIESELFGHVRGAFTGAMAAREGRIPSAHGGTLFLDEIGEMPLAAQAKLLRVLQDRTVTPVGADKAVSVDVRIVAATNKDLAKRVAEGEFREDLYYRINVIHVELPPLRERGDDLLLLADHFMATANQRYGRRVEGFDDSARKALAAHRWAGNVRELANVVERAVILKGHGTINAGDLRLGPKPARRVHTAPYADTPEPDTLNLRDALERTEKKLIEAALDKSGGNRTEAAALLGLNRTTLVEKLRKHAA